MDRYERYRIPPNFHISETHAQASYPYDVNSAKLTECPCCHRWVCSTPLPLLSPVSQLKKMGEQIPVFFYFIRGSIILILVMVFIVGGQFIFFADDANKVYPSLPQSINQYKKAVGFVQESEGIFLMELVFGGIALMLFKVYVKVKKYKSKGRAGGYSNTSLMLRNLHKEATTEEVLQIFRKRGIKVEEVTLTYKVNDYHTCMKDIFQLKKQLNIASSAKIKDHQQITNLDNQIQEELRKIRNIKKNILQNSNRLSIAFVILKTREDRSHALSTFKVGFCYKLFLKLCTCCSKSAIRGQHINIMAAPDPEDVNWENLESPYMKTKILTVVSYLICFVFVGLGVFFEPFIASVSESNGNTFLFQNIRTVSVLVVNFVMVSFIEWTSVAIEKYSTKSDKIWTLINKMSFFLFFNISITPFLIFAYQQTNQPQPLKSKENLYVMVFSIISISIGNLLKPLITYFSVERFTKWIKQKIQKWKGKKSLMDQTEANQLFQPIQFPIEVYYSLVISSLAMCFFYSSIIQFLFILELIGLLLAYLGAKMMIVRVCKQPVGLSLKISNLAQSLLRAMPLISCFGRGSILYFVVNKHNGSYIGFVLWRDGFVVVAWVLSILMLVSEDLVSFVALKIRARDDDDSLFEPLVRDNNRVTYRQANLFNKLQKQHLSQLL